MQRSSGAHTDLRTGGGEIYSPYIRLGNPDSRVRTPDPGKSRAGTLNLRSPIFYSDQKGC